MGPENGSAVTRGRLSCRRARFIPSIHVRQLTTPGNYSSKRPVHTHTHVCTHRQTHTHTFNKECELGPTWSGRVDEVMSVTQCGLGLLAHRSCAVFTVVVVSGFVSQSPYAMMM